MVKEFLEDTEKAMKKAIESLKSDLRSIRTGRANPALLDRVRISYYGVPTPIKQAATITVPEGRLLVVKPWDKSILKEIERSILASNLGLNPSNDGELIRITIPALTQQRRRELVRQVGKRTEDARISVRNSRRELIKDLKDLQKDGDISEDELHRGQDKVEVLTKKYVKQVDENQKEKEAEIMEI